MADNSSQPWLLMESALSYTLVFLPGNAMEQKWGARLIDNLFLMFAFASSAKGLKRPQMARGAETRPS